MNQQSNTNGIKIECITQKSFNFNEIMEHQIHVAHLNQTSVIFSYLIAKTLQCVHTIKIFQTWLLMIYIRSKRQYRKLVGTKNLVIKSMVECNTLPQTMISLKLDSLHHLILFFITLSLLKKCCHIICNKYCTLYFPLCNIIEES